MLAAGEIHHWVLPSEAAHVDRILSDGRRLLSDKEQESFATSTDERIVRRRCLSRILMRRALGIHLGSDPKSLVIEAGENGKPRLVSPRAEALDFSMSHSGSDLVFAVARAKRVGVDLEAFARAPKALEIARHFFAKSEIERLQRTGMAAGDVALMHWALKEAIAKAMGRTVWEGLKGMQVSIENNGIDWCCEFPIDDKRRWRLELGVFRNAFVYAVACEESEETNTGKLYHIHHTLECDQASSPALVFTKKSI